MTRPINTFTRVTVERLQNEVRRALAPIAEAHGIRLEMGRGSFSANAFTLKVEGAVVAADGTAVTREAEAFLRCAEVYGLKPEDLGRSILFRGGTAKIVGLNSRASKMPILVEDSAGKRWKIGAENARLRLSSRAAEYRT
jgi:hypothetical protein